MPKRASTTQPPVSETPAEKPTQKTKKPAYDRVTIQPGEITFISLVDDNREPQTTTPRTDTTKKKTR